MPKQTCPLFLFAFSNERQDGTQVLAGLSDERRAIETALAPAERMGLCELKILPNATLAEIFATFQDKRYRDRIVLFHYGGHANGAELLLERNDRENEPAHREGLVPLLRNQKSLQLVFLNGCSTEQWAFSLNEAGIPLVVGTFEAIRDNVAQNLAAQFYAGLGQGMPLRRAWEEAIARIRTETGDNLRSIGRDDASLDRFPWGLFQRKGADEVNQWNLPDATGDPLAALPLPESYKNIPLPNEPFRFLDRYRKADAPIFFGRGHDIRNLHDRLTNPVGSPVVLLSGQSGVGKSSLLEAGLLPRLEDRCTVLYLRRSTETSLRTTLKDALKVGDTSDDLQVCWKRIEAQTGKPLICIMDQAEEAFTREGGKGEQEIETFAHALNSIFGDVNTRPQGKILIGFRKEYVEEFKKVLKQQKIDYESVFLKRLSYQGILEAVNGLSSAPRLVQKYGVQVEKGLPETIASDLLADSNTPVSPVLQIILTKLWGSKGEDCIFTQKTYVQLKEKGVFLGDFFQQQMEKLRAWERQVSKDVESSGLALDILNSHTTDLGFANSRSMEELKIAYQHRADVLEDLIKQCKELYLLTDVGERRNALAHDTLASVVQQEVKNSDRPGQKALRILVGKTANYKRNADQTFIDEADLALVEQGRMGMRMWVEAEPELVKKSQERRSALRRQRRLSLSAWLLLGGLAAWFGYSIYQKSRIEQWVSQARLEAGSDPTIALHTLQKAVDLAPDNTAVMAALNDIWSNNEFYERALVHSSAVKGVILAPDSSKTLYSWTENTVYRWTTDGVKKDSFPTKDISVVTLSPDGLFLMLCTQNGNIAQLEAATLGEVQTVPIFGNEYATHLVFSMGGNTLFAASTDTTIFLLQSNKLKTVKKRLKVSNKISGLSINPYRGTLLVGFVDGSAEERDTEGTIIRTLNKHRDQVLSFTVSPKDSTVTSAGRDAQIIFQGQSGSNHLTLKGHDRSINEVAWSPDGSRLFSASNDHHIKTWSPEGDLVSVYRGHVGFVNGISVSKDGQYFASAGEDKTVRVWKTDSRILHHYGPHLGGVSDMMISKDGKTILTTSDAGQNDMGEKINDLDFDIEEFIAMQSNLYPRSVLLWNTSNGSLQGEWKGHKGGINALASDKDGKTIVTASDDSTVIIWSETGSPMIYLSNGHIGKVLDVAVSPDGQYISTVGEDGLTILWDKNGVLKKRIPQNDEVRDVAFSPDGKLFATACHDGSVRLYDLSGVEKSVIGKIGGQRVEAICFAPDGQSILAGEWGNTAHLYTVKGEVIGTFSVYSENKTGGKAIKSVAISPDGKNFALGAEGGLAQVFRLVGDRTISVHQLQHFSKRAILSVAFTPDGKGLLTGSNDHWGRWWAFNK